MEPITKLSKNLCVYLELINYLNLFLGFIN